MVAYSFKPMFVPLIRAGTKRQTIRAVGQRRHARVGEGLQLYCGMRTAHCFKILEQDPRCERVDPVLFIPGAGDLRVAGEQLRTATALDRYARQDGFDDFAQMVAFWLEEHGPRLFRGNAYVWSPYVTV